MGPTLNLLAWKNKPSCNSYFNSPPENQSLLCKRNWTIGEIFRCSCLWLWLPLQDPPVRVTLNRGAKSCPGGLNFPRTLASVPWIDYLFYCIERCHVFLKHSIPNTWVNSDLPGLAHTPGLSLGPASCFVLSSIPASQVMSVFKVSTGLF